MSQQTQEIGTWAITLDPDTNIWTVTITTATGSVSFPFAASSPIVLAIKTIARLLH